MDEGEKKELLFSKNHIDFFRFHLKKKMRAEMWVPSTSEFMKRCLKVVYRKIDVDVNTRPRFSRLIMNG